MPVSSPTEKSVKLSAAMKWSIRIASARQVHPMGINHLSLRNNALKPLLSGRF
jgi:hypothetical protein